VEKKAIEVQSFKKEGDNLATNSKLADGKEEKKKRGHHTQQIRGGEYI